MSETKYEQYIITELKPKVEAPWAPVYRPEEITRMLNLDNDVVKKGFYVETAWFLPPMALRTDSEIDVKPHQHDFDEVLAVFGSDPKDPHNLNAELEVWLDGEKHIITKSCMVFIPKGLRHGPIRFNKMEKPVFHFACGNTPKYN